MSVTVCTKPLKVKNFLYHCIGAAFIILNKFRNMLKGYRNARTFNVSEFKRTVEYDFEVFEKWLKYLEIYKGSRELDNKVVLELGPGPDLGIGLITLLKGAFKYYAVDRNNLVKLTPKEFYEELFRDISDKYGEEYVCALRYQLDLWQAGKVGRLNYIWDIGFDLQRINEDVDVVFSQAAFEHFGDLDKTFSQLSQVVKKGAVLITEIDLKTHTRWIRDVDPLNIYRYSDLFYNLFKFPGSPNRLRPWEYEEVIRKHGWKDIKVIPVAATDGNYFAQVKNRLNRRFRDDKNQMTYLSIILCATKE